MKPRSPAEPSPPSSVCDAIGLAPRHDDSFPASASQRRLWFLHRLDPGAPVYNMPRVWRVSGPVDVDVLADAIAWLIVRHDQLRTNFILKDRVLFQIVAASPVTDLPLIDLTGHADAEREMTRILKEQIAKPFDLEHDMMLRTSLIRLEPDDHVLVLVTHHIVSDRWSSSIFHRELGEFYESISGGRSPELEELPIQYGDYSEQERDYLQTEEARQSLDYWTRHLAGVPLLLQMPCDHSRPATQGHRGAQHSFTICEDLVSRLRKLSQRERVTLSTALLAVFQAFLYRTSHQDGFVVGVPVAGRSRAEFEGLMGNFVNTLPLRTELTADHSFTRPLKDTSRTMLDALDHQNIPVESVIDALRPERSLSYAPVFQVMFNFVNRGEERLQITGLKISSLDVHNRTSLVDLTLYVNADGSCLQAMFEYDVDLFDPATIVLFANRFLQLIESVVSDPDMLVSRIEWIPACEQADLSEWNATAAPFSENSGIHQLVEERSRQKPDAVALVCDRHSLTYRHLEERANRAAHFLLNRGAGPDTRIAIAMERSVDLVVGLLAILKTGAAYVPLDLSQPRARLQSIVEDSDAAFLLTRQRAASGVGIAGPQQVLIERAIHEEVPIGCRPGTALRRRLT